jgi:primosomal protein N' (replication factor Y)
VNTGLPVTTSAVARVMIDSPLPQLDRLFDYAIPDSLAAAALPGVRVRVPLRSIGRIADGYIVEVTSAGGFAGALSELDSVVSSARVLAPEIWTLCRRLADRAAGNASDIVRLAVPKRQVRVEKAWLLESAAESSAQVVPIAVAGFDTDRIDLALATGGRLAVDAVPRVVEVRSTADAPSQWVGHWAITMAACATRALAAGGSAILAVPDYRDQEQLVTALRAVLPADRIVHLDARQPNPDRYHALLACLGDTPLAIVGNRSVLYAPAKTPALIAVWDEGDPLHNEPLGPYVHARDIALVRQELQGPALFFLSHTRSTEVERLVGLGWLDELAAVRPVAPKVLPTAQQQSQDRLAAQARIPSSAWREARAALEHGPVLVQVARPGYAPRLACAGCGNTARCQRCEGPLRLKTARSTPSCSWCGKLATQWSCSQCAGTDFRMVGQGTGRTAEDLGRAFPGVRIIIADGDRPILAVDAAPALVIATRGAEPIAAGGYRAVLLLDGERMLARESLRVGEDCLRWWSNAIALAAPGATTVLVGVGGALASALATWQRFDYLRSDLADRRALRFPPAVRVATVTGTPETVQAAVSAIRAIDRVDVLGPVEAVEGGVRAIVRFDYAEGAAVATGLRAEVIRAATARRSRAGGANGRMALPTLRVRFDDALSLDSTE